MTRRADVNSPSWSPFFFQNEASRICVFKLDLQPIIAIFLCLWICISVGWVWLLGLLHVESSFSVWSDSRLVNRWPSQSTTGINLDTRWFYNLSSAATVDRIKLNLGPLANTWVCFCFLRLSQLSVCRVDVMLSSITNWLGVILNLLSLVCLCVCVSHTQALLIRMLAGQIHCSLSCILSMCKGIG